MSAAALLVGSALLFTSQPMIGRMVLPLAGGTPAVWTTCLLFFQAGLLAGYLYAHLTTRWLPLRVQMAVHAIALLLPIAVLPIGIDASWGAPDPAQPIPWLLARLTRSAGLPFVVLAANAPLVQRWFAATGHRSASDPYFLYAASNVGSLSGLLAYPVLIEPRLTLAGQGAFWGWGYGVLTLLTWGVMAAAARHPAGRARAADAVDAHPSASGTPLRWLVLSFVPSTLMLSVTTYISTDIAAVPLLWVLPLGIYLVTFVLVFARREIVPHRWMTALLPIAVVPPILTLLIRTGESPDVLIPIHLTVLFVAAMVCHGELVRARPRAADLTGFYLWIATGGVLGGIFSVLVAPLIFRTPLEYPLALVLACACRPVRADRRAPTPLDYAPLVVAALLAVQMLVTRALRMDPMTPATALLIFLPPLLCALASPRPQSLAASLAIVLVAGTIWDRAHARNEHLERNFFGVQRVELSSGGRFRAFVHGNTIHGTQALDPARRRQPTTYYARSGPAGDVLSEKLADASRVAAVGLGAGTMAAYASGNQRWVFYEINPSVERIAADPRYFTYLADCGRSCEVVAGDARLTLARSPGSFDVIVLDAFNSDAIPVHLLTREALALYRRLLAPGGVILVHLSNRFLDLRPVVAALAEDAGMVGMQRTDMDVDLAAMAAGKFDSCWAVLAGSRDDLKGVATNPDWSPLQREPGIGVWTDDFSNVFALLLKGTGGPFARP